MASPIEWRAGLATALPSDPWISDDLGERDVFSLLTGEGEIGAETHATPGVHRCAGWVPYVIVRGIGV